MKRLARLWEQLDRELPASEKIETLSDYFAALTAEEGVAALTLLLEAARRRARKPAVPPLAEEIFACWAREHAGLPPWLFAESVKNAGNDVAETAALLLGNPVPGAEPVLPAGTLARECAEWGDSFARLSDEERRAALLRAWTSRDVDELRLIHALVLTGRLPARISESELEGALSRAFALPRELLAHRLEKFRGLTATAQAFERLTAAPASDDADEELVRVYPFDEPVPFSAALSGEFEALGDCREWSAADVPARATRVQLLRRAGRVLLWSAENRPITEKHREITQAGACLPDGTVLTGELADDRRFVAWDLLEDGGADTRATAWRERQTRLQALLPAASPYLGFRGYQTLSTWRELEHFARECRTRGARGIWLRHARRAEWLEWKPAARELDAVLLYAQQGEYTFGVWDEPAQELIPVAKASAGLTDLETAELDRWVKRHTRERFGPVRSVEPSLVFRIAYDEVLRAPRRKAGLELVNPRIVTWRRDHPVAEAARISGLR